MITKIKIRPKPSSRPAVISQKIDEQTEVQSEYSINMEYSPEEDKIYLEYKDGGGLIKLELNPQEKILKNNITIKHEILPEKLLVIEFTGTTILHSWNGKNRIEITTIRG